MDKNLTKLLLEFVEISVDLSNSVRSDAIGEDRVVSNDTIILLNKFRLKHDELSEILDLLNGIQ